MSEYSVAPEVAPVRHGEDLDWPTLENYLKNHISGLDGAMSVAQFPHGNANLTYSLTFENRELVVRRPPFGEIAPGAHDMRRESQVLFRLWRYYDRAPRAYLFCDDESVIGASFVVMERRAGEVIRSGIPTSMLGHADVGQRVGYAVVDAMADLHLLRPRDCGLGELGRPAGFVARQVAGWRARWNLAKPAHAPEVMAQIGIRLEASLPTSGPPSILHNDLKLDNCQFDPANPDRVSSVFDWDMATLGDPLVDLGTLLSYWPDPSDSRDACRATHPGLQTIGLPRRSEIVDRYGLRTGANVDNVGWYEALAQWKTAIVVQQLYNRYLRGETSDPRMKELGSRMPRLAAGASAILDQMMGV